MNVISSASLGLSYSDLQRDLQKVMKSQNTAPQKPQPEHAAKQPQAERKPTFGTSLYDVYGLEQGFSKDTERHDSVEISQLAKMLYQAEQNREVWNSSI